MENNPVKEAVLGEKDEAVDRVRRDVGEQFDDDVALRSRDGSGVGLGHLIDDVIGDFEVAHNFFGGVVLGFGDLFGFGLGDGLLGGDRGREVFDVGGLIAVQYDAEHKTTGQGDNTDRNEDDERRSPGEQVHGETGLVGLALAAAGVASLTPGALAPVLLALLASTVSGHGAPRCDFVSRVSLLRLRVYEGAG